ncbi:MAG TPA: aminopeptidase P N-terminal domain-containing protein, partial [Bryobacteraceae bacterium]|nr:aminopeptidase P N-terminal domain-containing protein [Bryobacteraceae bacterium]
MRTARIAAGVFLFVFALAGAVPRAEYGTRRAAARKALGDSVLVLFGRTEAEMEDHSAATVQEPDFYYLTGWKEPGAVLLLSTGSEVLFLPKHDAAHEVYTGVRAAASDPDALAVTGFSDVLAIP